MCTLENKTVLLPLLLLTWQTITITITIVRLFAGFPLISLNNCMDNLDFEL